MKCQSCFARLINPSHDSQGVEKEPLSEEKPLQFQANFWEEQRPGEKLRMGKEYPSSRDCEEPPAWTHLSG
jgi:hypothetical protein